MWRILAALLLLLLAGPALAWGPQGHEVVAVIASQHLSGTARAEVARLLGGNAMMVHDSNWADEIRDRRRDTSSWHYVDIPLGARGYDPRRDCPDGDCVVAQIEKDMRVLANRGAASARNRGVRDASGEVLAFLDVDDLWPDNKIAVMVEALLAYPALDVVQGYAQVMTRNPDSGAYEYSGNPEESYPYYIGAALYRRRAFETIGLFDPHLRFSEDSDWFTRAREGGLMVKRLEQVTLLVRRHGDNMTSGKSMVELNALQVLKKALDRKRATS